METNKHGVNYSEIQVGDLVKLRYPHDGSTTLGYVTFSNREYLMATRARHGRTTRESHDTGNIIRHWKVVDFRKVPTKPYKQLMSFERMYPKGEKTWGVYCHTEGDKLWGYWGNISEEFAYGFIHKDSLVDLEDIIIHEEKPKAFTFSDFDASVKRTWKDQDFKDAVSNAALGLTGESGEVADLIKKAVYHGRGFNDGSLRVRSIGYDYEHGVSPEDVKDELSDVLYYVSATAQEFGFTLEDIAKHNKEKLEKRFPEGFSTEASAQKADREVIEVKEDYYMKITSSAFSGEDTVRFYEVTTGIKKWMTFIDEDHELQEELINLRNGQSLKIIDEHNAELTFTKDGELFNVTARELDEDTIEFSAKKIRLEGVQK